MDIKEIQNLIKFVAKSGASEVKLEMEDIKITIKTGGEDRLTIKSLPVAQTLSNEQNSHVTGNEKEIVSEESNLITIKSPIIGTFYRKPAPEKPILLKLESNF